MTKVKVWFSILSKGLKTKAEAEAWRRWHYTGRTAGNEVPRHKLSVRRDVNGKYRVVRKRHEWEVDNDPLYGTGKRLEQFKRYLDVRDKQARRKIRGKLK